MPILNENNSFYREMYRSLMLGKPVNDDTETFATLTFHKEAIQLLKKIPVKKFGEDEYEDYELCDHYYNAINCCRRLYKHYKKNSGKCFPELLTSALSLCEEFIDLLKKYMSFESFDQQLDGFYFFEQDSLLDAYHTLATIFMMLENYQEADNAYKQLLAFCRLFADQTHFGGYEKEAELGRQKIKNHCAINSTPDIANNDDSIKFFRRQLPSNEGKSEIENLAILHSVSPVRDPS